MADWVYYNPNPLGKIRAVDCTIRAICAVTGQDWDTTYTEACLEGFIEKNMPSANSSWRAYLRRKGFGMAVLPDDCPDCYSVADFADDHPTGKFVIGTGNHAVACVDGCIMDTWRSLDEPVLYFFYEKEKK